VNAIVDLAAALARALQDRRAAWILAAYLVGVFALRIALFPGMSQDDAEQLFYAQHWAWGYKPNQPPLYFWLVMSLQSVFGVSAVNVVAVKFACLATMYTFYYLATLRIAGDRRLALIASLTILGFFYVGWDMVVNYATSAVLMAFMPATLWAVMRIEEKPSVPRFAILGVFVALGFLSKFNYGLFLVPLLVAVGFTPELCRRVLVPAFAVTWVVALAMAGPYYLWFLGAQEGLAAAEMGTASVAPSGNRLEDLADGLWALMRGSVAILLPGVAITAGVFWSCRRRGDGSGPSPDGDLRDRRRGGAGALGRPVPRHLHPDPLARRAGAPGGHGGLFHRSGARDGKAAQRLRWRHGGPGAGRAGGARSAARDRAGPLQEV